MIVSSEAGQAVKDRVVLLWAVLLAFSVFLFPSCLRAGSGQSVCLQTSGLEGYL